MNKLIHVAVGVIFGPDGRVLIAKRPQSAHQGGLWEFPGGKVEAGESVELALTRELQEELSIFVTSCKPLIQIRHHYPDKSVLLDVYKVLDFTGVPRGAEGQPTKWVSSHELTQYEFPAANKPIITATSLPERYLITGKFSNEADLLNSLDSALNRGIRLVQLRLQDVELSKNKMLLTRIFSIVEKYSAKLILNTDIYSFNKILEMFPVANLGLHLNRHQAAAVTTRPVPDNYLFGISCHDEQEIEHAQHIGADYLLLSPVKVTRSHPSAAPLGWEKFKQWVELANVPVYALGGVDEGDLEMAALSGAQGIAGISAWWSN